MDNTSAAAPGPPAETRRRGPWWRRMGQDYAYVLPGFPLALFAFALLVPMAAVALGTLIIWVGLPLLMLTLVIASGFAELSRARIRRWGGRVPPAHYRPAGRGARGALRIVADPRRWLDLVFETLVAFPMRLINFVVAVVWTAVALGGLTYALWAWSLPGGSGWSQVLELIAPAWVQDSAGEQYLFDAGVNAVIGLLFAVSLPLVLRGLAQLDAQVTSALLGGGEPGQLETIPSQPAAVAVPDRSWVARPGFSARAWTLLATGFAAVVLLAVGWPVIAALYGVHPALAMVLTVVHSGSAVLIVRSPGIGLGLAALATVGTITATADAAASSPWPWPVTTMLTHCVIVLVLALRRPWFWAAATWAGGLLLTIAAPLLGPGGIPTGAIANSIVLVSVSAAVSLVGALGRLWVLSASRVEQAETISADEARRRRELQERNRIARELHDVVAHSMSVINVQATTAQYRKPHIDESVRQEFTDIAQSSRRALNEMRSLLAILRGDDDAPTAPVPGLADIRELVEASRASGASISYSGDGADVSPTVGLTAFRVVQEALSNALRHSPGASVEVRTSVEDGQLRIRVANSAPEGRADPAPGSGLGLAGIRERVTALEGTAEAGPTAQGGFVVAATIPLETR